MKLNICPAPQTVKFALSSPRLRTWCLANGVLAVQRGSIVQDRAFNYIKSYSTLSNFDAALIRISISLRHKTLAKNMAQGPRSAKPHPLSDDQTPSNRINYFQTPSGPLRFFSADRVQRPSQLVRGAVTLAWLAYSMGFKRVAALGRVGYEQIWAAFSG